MVTIKFFASIRERLGMSQTCLNFSDIEPGLASQASSELTVGQVRQSLAAKGGVWLDCLGDHQVVRAAVNQQLVALDHPVNSGDELAFFPPVTGG